MDRCYYCGDLEGDNSLHVKRCKSIYTKYFSMDDNAIDNIDDLWLKSKQREYLKNKMMRETIRAKSETENRQINRK